MSDETRIVLIGGGARSGKSAFALSLARRLGARRAFVATAQAMDEEMKERIADHARTRGADFRTVEEPLALAERLLDLCDIDVVVIDCLTLWLSNLLLRDESETRILEQVQTLVGVLERRAFHAVIVTNEVGMGVVPETPLGRAFRDVAGRAHQRLAGVADEVYLAILGSVLRIRPEPVSVRILESAL
ncbi:bifunctional adenosylcobinamide kinase/adenosylcobinamide-phosphate guanylyltransferase [Candidatus Methylomirabilis limnetica]|uniref:Adenosylcobinamide kinase n=1 Tax=Candidatus Methylomirabilis limnetica TaxID=2033718 RepID=A0A2T4TX09_9BACT|nr:bifunctional adenosylcobinamide kinase/adenosylcobinamide-phosphate guanylyltransferase [Candidatus Methylomirabilis limnetica]PTL35636.1 bifunctional adenosylcobinamide kinase/adenosylcobinamide-phosphate guanylyltransferase [Candidatus Methylomirabilis limnetica]